MDMYSITKRQEEEFSEKTKKLIKAGLIYPDSLNLSDNGRSHLLEMLRDEFEGELLNRADEILEDKEDNS